jgi:hypothetical protein
MFAPMATCLRAIVVVGLVYAAPLAAQATAAVTGTVLDSATRIPVPGAIVAFHSGDRILTERTDEAGRFRIVRVPYGA